MTSGGDIYLGRVKTPLNFDSMFWLDLRCEVWDDQAWMGKPLNGKVEESDWRFCSKSGARSCELRD